MCVNCLCSVSLPSSICILINHKPAGKNTSNHKVNNHCIVVDRYFSNSVWRNSWYKNISSVFLYFERAPPLLLLWFLPPHQKSRTIGNCKGIDFPWDFPPPPYSCSGSPYHTRNSERLVNAKVFPEILNIQCLFLGRQGGTFAPLGFRLPNIHPTNGGLAPLVNLLWLILLLVHVYQNLE